MAVAVGCLDTSVHVHVCSCACWAVCLIWRWFRFFKEKTFPLAVARTRDSSLPLLPIPPFPSPCPEASRLREKHCIQTKGSGTSLQKVVGRALERKQFCSWPCSFITPFPVHCALAASSGALTEVQGCGAWAGEGFFSSWICLPPSPPTGAQWFLIALGPLYSN